MRLHVWFQHAISAPHDSPEVIADVKREFPGLRDQLTLILLNFSVGIFSNQGFWTFFCENI
jgi:hypothetical protein